MLDEISRRAFNERYAAEMLRRQQAEAAFVAYSEDEPQSTHDEDAWMRRQCGYN